MIKQKIMASTCWIIGRKATIAANGHEYVTEPFIVFESEEEAMAACDMVERVSGERPKIVDGSFYRVHQGRRSQGRP